jgi:hypothetical protein
MWLFKRRGSQCKIGLADLHGLAACGVRWSTVTKFSYRVTLQHFSRVAARTCFTLPKQTHCFSVQCGPAPLGSWLEVCHTQQIRSLFTQWFLGRYCPISKAIRNWYSDIFSSVFPSEDNPDDFRWDDLGLPPPPTLELREYQVKKKLNCLSQK